MERILYMKLHCLLDQVSIHNKRNRRIRSEKGDAVMNDQVDD
jgi:hypothetical protein